MTILKMTKILRAALWLFFFTGAAASYIQAKAGHEYLYITIMLTVIVLVLLLLVNQFIVELKQDNEVH